MIAREEILLAAIPKGVREEVRITRVGADVHIRVWFTSRDGREMRPSRDGITLRVGQVEALASALAKAVRQ